MSFDWYSLDQFKADKRFIDGYSSDVRCFWSPRDDVHGVLVSLLSSAQHSVVVNMYGFDDDELDSLIRQKMEADHVYVQMSLDSSQAAGVHEKELLAKWPAESLGTSIAIGRSVKHAISHLKVCIVDGTYTVKGSTNWSLAGEQKQDNELSISCNSGIASEARAVLDINHAEMLRQMASKPSA